MRNSITSIKTILILIISLSFFIISCSSEKSIEGLIRSGEIEEAMEKITDLNESENPKDRIRAAKLLGKIKKPQAYDMLISMTDDADINLQMTALSSLAKLQHPSGLSISIAKIPSASSGLYRDYGKIIKSYGKQGSDDLVATFINSKNKAPYKTVLLAVGVDSVDSIIKSMESKSYYENRETIDLLIKFRNPKVAAIMVGYIDDESVAQLVERGLTDLGSMVEPAVLKALNKKLARKNKSDQLAITRLINILGDIQSKTAIPVLEKVMNQHKSQELRNVATFNLKKIRGM